MNNRKQMEQKLPAMLAHEGIWVGTYRFVDIRGRQIDEYRSRIECVFPDDGPWCYVQKNHYEWADGRTFDTEFGGDLDGDRIFWDTDRFRGYGWVTHDDIVMLTLERKDNPGESFSEMIQLGEDGLQRARTWQWFRNGQPFQRTLCDEFKVTS